MIFITTPNDIRNLSKLSGLTWMYIGGNAGLKQAAEILNENRRLFIGKDIESIVDSVRGNFIDYIGIISKFQKNKVIWYSSPMASKSMSQTTIFHQYVYQKLVERLTQGKNEDILFVTDDDELLSNIRKIQLDKIRLLNKSIFYKKKIYTKFEGYRRVLTYFWLWVNMRFLRNRRLKEFDVFIHTWMDESIFGKLPQFDDSHFGNLEIFLRESGYKVARLSSLDFPLELIPRLQKYFSNIIYPLSYLRLADLLRSIFTKFTVIINGNSLAGIKDLKILNILAENEMAKENRSKNYLVYLILYYSYKNLHSKISRTASIIYPFENQPWEKMLNLAYRDFNRIGYQDSVIALNWLDYQNSPYEEAIPLPMAVLTSGKKWLIFLKKYYSSLKIEETGAIRYTYLLDRLKDRRGNTIKNIVVALPISLSIALALQYQILNSLKNIDLSDYIIKIKLHPDLPRFTYLDDKFAHYKNCQISAESISELLKDCVLLVTSGSSVAFEAVFSGIKTLYFIPEEISLGVEYFIREHMFIGYEEDFLEKFKEALESNECPRAKIEEYFSQPDYNVFLKYIKR